jgi:hypothetical protein
VITSSLARASEAGTTTSDAASASATMRPIPATRYEPVFRPP